MAAWSAVGNASDPVTIAPTGVVWRGFVNAVSEDKDLIFELSPDGSSFLYSQGRPWPRLMLQAVDGLGKEPVMLGTHAPISGRRPDFVSSGKAVYFTADRSWRPMRQGISNERVVNPAVLRVSIDGRVSKTIASSAMFLDLHPKGETLLIGRMSEVTTSELAIGSYALELNEVPASGGVSKPLGFSVRGLSFVEYAFDGNSILYTTGAPRDERETVRRWDRRTGLHSRVERTLGAVGTRAGVARIRVVENAHLGTFGSDVYVQNLVQKSADGPAIAVSIGPSFPYAPSGGVRIRSVGRRHLLFSGGPRERLEMIVASWDSVGFNRGVTDVVNGTGWTLDTDVTGGHKSTSEARSRSLILARAEGETRALLESLRRSLGADDTPVDSVRVRWSIQRRPEEGASGEIVEVVETAEGQARVERILPPLSPEDAEEREALIDDGAAVWHVAVDGTASRVTHSQLRDQLTHLSAYRLLLDPAGLGYPGLTFRAGPVKDGERTLTFRDVDGYHGKLVVRVNGAMTFPVRIVTPLLFSSLRARRGIGAVQDERRVTFDDFGVAAGRTVAHTIRFDNGYTPVELKLKSLELNPSLDNGVFAPDAPQEDEPGSTEE